MTQHTVNAQNDVPGDDDIYNDDSDTEKVEFPSNDKLIPTYSVAFQGGREVSPPTRWLSTQGPRLLNKLAQPFEAIARPKEAQIAINPDTDEAQRSRKYVAQIDSVLAQTRR